MKVLTLSDKVISRLYSPQIKELYGQYDLIIACGDLPYYYLEFIVTMLTVDVLYVYGNHDKTRYTSDGREVTRAEGCSLMEDQTAVYNGLIFAGLGGSMRYHPKAVNQYSEFEMWRRILRLAPKLLMNKLRYGRYLDVLITHSPPFGIHDDTDLPHRGFKGFLKFMDFFKPRYLLHGHQHLYRNNATRVSQYRQTTIVNVYPKMDFDWTPEDFGLERF